MTPFEAAALYVGGQIVTAIGGVWGFKRSNENKPLGPAGWLFWGGFVALVLGQVPTLMSQWPFS
jgi:hypothetical protein